MLMLIIVSAISFVSCQKETKVTKDTLESRLANDDVFKNVLTAAAEMGTQLNADALSNENNITTLQDIVGRINNQTATAADYANVKTITGVTYDEFIKTLQNFGLTLNELNKKYPELGKMNQADLSAIVTKSIQSNPDLQEFVSNPNGTELLRINGCPLRDLCNLAVTLTRLFAGETICAAINVTTIPVVGGILCQLVLNLGVGILTGICNALPC